MRRLVDWKARTGACDGARIRYGIPAIGLFAMLACVMPAVGQVNVEVLTLRGALGPVSSDGGHVLAGQVVSGFSKVEGAIEGRQAVALIHATDGAPDGIRKLNARLAAVMRENGAKSADFPVLGVLTTDELDLARGR